MNIVMQGMRRSGTTIAFDAFWEDGRFECLYEPLAAARPTTGGGSGAHGVDLFVPLRARRAAFLAANPDVRPDELNHGAPRAPELELRPEVPDEIRRYLASLFESDRPVVAKFTRLACKIDVIHEIQPDALFVHLVRDPRAVAASHLFGKDGVHRGRFRDEDAFFSRRSRRSTWSSRPLSQELLSRPENRHLRRLPDVGRVLLLWRDAVRSTHLAGQRFGERYVVLRHEDVAAEPVRYLGAVYERIGDQLPGHVAAWLGANVRLPATPFAASNPMWRALAERLEMQAELEAVGYEL